MVVCLIGFRIGRRVSLVICLFPGAALFTVLVFGHGGVFFVNYGFTMELEQLAGGHVGLY